MNTGEGEKTERSREKRKQRGSVTFTSINYLDILPSVHAKTLEVDM